MKREATMPSFFTAVEGNRDLDKQQLFPTRVPGSAVWSSGSTSTHHFTTSSEFVYNRRFPMPGSEQAYLRAGGGGGLAVECYGMLDLVLHGSGQGDVHMTLKDVAVVPGFAFDHMMAINLLAQETPMVLDATGISTADGRLLFSHGATGNYAQATRVPPGGTTPQ